MRTSGRRFITSAASSSRASTRVGVQSAMTHLLEHRALAMELFAELPDHFTFRPGETLIILAHHQDAVLVPTLTLDVVGRAPLSAVSFGRPPHGCASRAMRSAGAPRIEAGVLPSPSRPMTASPSGKGSPNISSVLFFGVAVKAK